LLETFEQLAARELVENLEKMQPEESAVLAILQQNLKQRLREEKASVKVAA